MKNRYILTILITILPILLHAQKTYVPDDKFEQALIDLGYDSKPLDDYVPTANISGVTELNISNKYIHDLTGIESFVALKELNVYGNTLYTIDLSSNTALTSLWCYSVNLTSLNISKNVALTTLICNDNHLPVLDLSKNIALIELNCAYNDLTALDLSKNITLTELKCNNNKLTLLYLGPSTFLTNVYCIYNNLSSLETSKNTGLIKLECHQNNITSLNLTANTLLTNLNCYNNDITSIDLKTNTKLTRLDLGLNKLNSLNLVTNTALEWLNCWANNLTTLELYANTALTRLSCGSNQLTALDLGRNTELTYLSCSNNQLTTLDLGRNIKLTSLQCRYNQLTTLNIKNGNNTLEFMKANGNPNLTCIQVDNYEYAVQRVQDLYWSKGSVSSFAESCGGRDCWETGVLTFCLSSGKWEGVDGEDKITTNNILSINDFLFFDGTITIDTVALEFEADGEFYVDNIPLPGGGIGKYTLLKGEHKLTLIGNEGKIMDFLNSNLSKTASLFGAQLKIDELHFFSRQDTFGVKMGCSAHISGVSESCGNPGFYTPGTDLVMKNVEITNKGIMSAGFEVENLGLFKDGYCLNRISAEYDWKNDIITAGADISLPFFANISGGFRLEQGEIDSVAWGVEGSDSAFVNVTPTGLGTLGIRGFYGHISGLNQPGAFDPTNMDIKFGGIFSDITSENWYRITADGRTIWPKLFEFSGSGKFLKPGDFPYQIQSEDVKATYNVPNKILKISYGGKFLTMDEQSWLATGSGNYTINHSKDETEINGDFRGDITLPEISSWWPFNWFNSKVFGTALSIFNENINIGHGQLYYYPVTNVPGWKKLIKLNYIINVEKSFYESGYIQFPEKSRVEIFIETEKSGTIDNNVTETFIIPENSKFGVIEIKSQSEAPISSIKSPSGKIFTATSFDDDILFSETEDKKTAFWTFLLPASGDWQITLENPEINDSVISHYQLKANDFEFTMNQTANIINLDWDVAQVDSGQVINFMFDDDSTGFDGFRIISTEASLGTISFILDEKYPDCNYFLYAQLVNDEGVKEVYADNILENYLAVLAPPENFSFVHNSQSGKIDFVWNTSPSPEVTGYILSVINNSLGEDSVYAVLSSETENISLFIENFEDKYAKIESYNLDWKIGCPAVLPSLVTALHDKNLIEEPTEKIRVYPNPTTGNCTIRYYVAEPSKCEIRIFNIQGKEIAQPLTGFQPVGFHQFDFQYENLPDGMYLIKYVNNNQSVTVKSVLSK